MPPRTDADAWDCRGGTSPWTWSQGRMRSQRTWSCARERPTRCQYMGHRRLAGRTGGRGGGGRYSLPRWRRQHDSAPHVYLPRQRRRGVAGGLAVGRQCQGCPVGSDDDWRRRGQWTTTTAGHSSPRRRWQRRRRYRRPDGSDTTTTISDNGNVGGDGGGGGWCLFPPRL